MRFVACGNFLFAVAVFFLPWIDVRCEMGGSQSKSLIEQSGYQVAVGEYSQGEAFKDLEKQMGGKAGGNGPVMKKQNAEGKEDGPEAAPMLWGFIGMLGVGAVLSLVVPGKAWRIGALIGAIGAAGVLGIQTAQGFPVEKKVKEDMEKAQPPNQPNLNAPIGPKMDLDIPKPKMVVTYKPGYYLAWGLALLPLLWVAIDAMTAGAPARRRGRDPYDDVDRDRDRDDDRGRGRGRDDYEDNKRNPFNDD